MCTSKCRGQRAIRLLVFEISSARSRSRAGYRHRRCDPAARRPRDAPCRDARHDRARGSAAPKTRGCAAPVRPRPLCRRRASGWHAARRGVSKLAGAWTNSEHRRRRGGGRARGCRRIHACGIRCGAEADPAAHCRDARIRAFSATAAGHGQGAVCRRAHGRRGGDQSVPRGGCRKPDLGRHRGPAAGVELGAGRRSLGAHPRRRGNQHNEHRGRARRRGRGLQGCLLCAARALHCSPAYCRSLGGARAGCGMGRFRDAHDRVRHHQGALLQSHHARLHARSSRSFGRDESGGRRRRIWCSRGILSGRLPHPRSGAAARPAGEMDRGPPRALSCDQSFARSRLRSGDRVRPGGESSSGCAAR